MFYVYYKQYYPVYEPAEGGYYVSCSEVRECHEFTTLESAYAELFTMVAQAQEEGSTVSASDWRVGFQTCCNETYLMFPWVVFDKTGYVGDGFELGISAEEPEDERYRGYC